MSITIILSITNTNSLEPTRSDHHTGPP